MVVRPTELVAVPVLRSIRRAADEPGPVDPSPDWCDDESAPHVVGVVEAIPPDTPEPPVGPPPAPAPSVVPLPAVVFLALLVVGYAAGFGIGLFAPR
ncbi:hypothetical protein [Gemmata sp.]|uniref:hypothetical protein n=1 Tax=Gemmata sp. TaxID=1914242 RepID=UPI003F729DB2